MLDHYILNKNGEPVKELDLLTWAKWFEADNHRVVKQEWIGEAKVSTVFLGLDHRFSGGGPPILWETMVFNGRLNETQRRCAGSREQAQAMHDAMVEEVKTTLKPK